MYGEERLNSHNVLRYGLTKEFMEKFSPLTYEGLELPLALLRNYHLHIAPLVEQNLSNESLVDRIREKHRFFFMRDVQHALERRPPVERDLAEEPGRNVLAVQAGYLPFVLDRFPGAAALVILRNIRDEMSLHGHTLPGNYRTFCYRDELGNAYIKPQVVSTVLAEADALTQKYQDHLVFARPEFRLWFHKALVHALKVVHILNRAVINEKIRVILSDVEVFNPDSTLSLLASRYNLTFINAPLVMITDRNLVPTRASCHCAWGDNYYRWLRKRGIDGSRIVRTGNLRFKYDRRPGILNRKELAVKLKFPRNNYITAFTTQSLPETVNRTLAGWIADSVPGLPVTVLIKRHPSDQTDYSDFTRKGAVIELPPSFELYDLLPCIDFLMTISSNTAVEAALYRKGIIVLQPPVPYHYDRNNNDYHLCHARARAGPVASTAGELQGIFAGICGDEGMRKKLRHMAEIFLERTIHKGFSSTPSDDIHGLIRPLLEGKGNGE